MRKKLLKFIFRLFISIGINPKGIINLKYFLRYLKTEQEWLKQGGRITKRFIFLNGRLDFHNIKSNKLTIIHTDSHPNAFAHKIILNKNFDLFGTN